MVLDAIDQNLDALTEKSGNHGYQLLRNTCRNIEKQNL